MKYVEEVKALAMYDDALNEAGPLKIGSLEYDPAEVLKSVDSTAYRCGFIGFCDLWDITTTEEEGDNEN